MIYQFAEKDIDHTVLHSGTRTGAYILTGEMAQQLSLTGKTVAVRCVSAGNANVLLSHGLVADGPLSTDGTRRTLTLSTTPTTYPVIKVS